MSDPIDVVMEEALRPGRYICEHAPFSLVNELQSVAARIAGADRERAVGLYETFIAACHEKAEEVDGQDPLHPAPTRLLPDLTERTVRRA